MEESNTYEINELITLIREKINRCDDEHVLSNLSIDLRKLADYSYKRVRIVGPYGYCGRDS